MNARWCQNRSDRIIKRIHLLHKWLPSECGLLPSCRRILHFANEIIRRSAFGAQPAVDVLQQKRRTSGERFSLIHMWWNPYFVFFSVTSPQKCPFECTNLALLERQENEIEKTVSSVECHWQTTNSVRQIFIIYFAYGDFGLSQPDRHSNNWLTDNYKL